MITRPADTFRRQARLAIALSWVGGYANVVVLIHTGMTVSHVTGNLTHLGELAVEHRWPAAWLTGFLPLCFLAGATLAGACEQYAIRRRARLVYVLPIAIEAALLALLSFAISWQDAHAADATPPAWRSLAFYLVTGVGSLAMGLQNATITRISGAAVRTTHLTGVVTDVGLELAALVGHGYDEFRRHGPRRWRRWRRVARVMTRWPAVRRLALLGAIAGSFVVGVVVGTYVYETFPELALLPPALFLLTIVRSARLVVHHGGMETRREDANPD